MHVIVLDCSDPSTLELERKIAALAKRSPTWVLMYGAEDSPFDTILAAMHRHCPRVPAFGATSFGGVFTSSGFLRKVCLLAGDVNDGIRMAVSLQQVGASHAKECAAKACHEISSKLGTTPNMLLLHATPGFEERILEGVASVHAKNVPVFGGSAADDLLAGKARVFAGTAVVREGFVLAGIASARDLQGAFMGGFLPTEHVGTITRVEGRVVSEIDGRPAAELYDEWTGGVITQQLKSGGSVVLNTNLSPLSRTVGTAHGMQRRILSHPHSVILPTKALSFFSEFKRADQVTLMTSTADPLVSRVRGTVERARGSQARVPRGALLVYCAGSLSTMLDQADRICREFERAVAGAPFVGIATAGEQGAFFANAESWHGNLMCATVLF
jgi:hypothetical protein